MSFFKHSLADDRCIFKSASLKEQTIQDIGEMIVLHLFRESREFTRFQEVHQSFGECGS
jgi:hypothetical protein